jgi:hypothetical protein
MKKGLIILADANQVGIGYKLILPIVKYFYIKGDSKYQIINLYREGFDPMVTDTITGSITRSYMHAIKTADEIHVITNSHLGGISPSFEGFIERIFKNDFAYQRDGSSRMSRLKSKDIYYYVTYNTKRFRYGPVWLRLKFIIGKLFKSSTVFQIYLDDVLQQDTKQYKARLNKSIKKKLNKNRS